MTQLLLRAPYGAGNGDHISMRCEKMPSWRFLKDVLLGYGCYPPALPTIEASLRGCGRYDCVLQTGWFRGQWFNLRADLKALGVELSVLEFCEWKGPTISPGLRTLLEV